MSGEMTLIYFNGRGRAELIRYMFKLAGKSFTDERLDQQGWDEKRKQTALGQLPVLQHGEYQIPQTMAIAGYVAREFGLAGSNNCEQTICEVMCCTASDLMDAVINMAFMGKTEEDKAAGKEKLVNLLVGTEKLVKSMKKGAFILGEKPSLADVAMASTLEYIQGLLPGGLDSHEVLKGLLANFMAVPAIAEYVKQRPKTDF